MNGVADARKRRTAFEEARSQQQATYDTARKDVTVIETRRLAEGIPLTRLRNGLPSAASVQGRLVNFRAALPSLPTAVLSSGTADTLPQRYAYRSGERFSPFTRTSGTRVLGGLFPERQTENPASLLNGSFDLGFVSVYIWPVLILALTYGVVSTDREAGVLALVLAQPISFRRWLLA
jgi:ABC-2 type transport system permease protein